MKSAVVAARIRKSFKQNRHRSLSVTNQIHLIMCSTEFKKFSKKVLIFITTVCIVIRENQENFSWWPASEFIPIFKPNYILYAFSVKILASKRFAWQLIIWDIIEKSFIQSTSVKSIKCSNLFNISTLTYLCIAYNSYSILSIAY